MTHHEGPYERLGRLVRTSLQCEVRQSAVEVTDQSWRTTAIGLLSEAEDVGFGLREIDRDLDVQLASAGERRYINGEELEVELVPDELRAEIRAMDMDRARFKEAVRSYARLALNESLLPGGLRRELESALSDVA